MKLNKLAAATALAMAAPLAFAHAPSVTPEYVINISGASAQQLTLGHLLTDSCQAGTLDIYYDGTSGSSWRSYFCTLNNAAPVPTSLRGKRVLFNNRAKGGSAWGVQPVALNWNVEYLNIFWDNDANAANGVNCTDANADRTWLCPTTTRSADVVSDECPRDTATYTQHRSTQCIKSDAGVSDVEPKLFNASVNLPSGWSALTSAQLNGLSVEAQYGVIFGAAVSKAISDAYIAEGKFVVGDDGVTYADFKKSEIASLLKVGGFGSWYDLNAIAGDAAVNDVKVCRRVQGSGTQAAAQAYFLNSPCADAVSGALPMVSATGLSNGQTTVNNSSNGTLVTCLNSDTATVGFLATERKPSASDNWRFVAIDGVAPTVANANSGLYDYVYEQTMQWRSALTGVKLDGVRFIRQQSGSHTVLSKTSGGNPIFPGVSAIADSSNNWETNYPVLRGSRGGNSCAPVQLAPSTL